MPAINRKIITLENPQSPISEAYKTLRTNIQWSSIERPVQTILVTSPEKNAGKSLTVVNMAVSFTQLGKKVVIVDCDLRKPTQHEYFKKSNRNGLSHLLAGHYQLEQCLVDTHIDNLTLLPSGTVPPNPAELLESGRMLKLIEELKASFDIIVIDSPPTLVVTDAHILASKCDGVVFVIRSGKTKKDLAQKALAYLNYANAHILGVVLNDQRDMKGEIQYGYGG
ncbi:CpsD/CapB family tyrosine-protein kinase [Cohnella silvisoli]|uniref:non-specific protein-tyrosine kinase n=1 Tax=Cohnella silvisoli TaxID=2873699 RepID=A0ABV1KW20_9BACL|nr:CpsD/CapB family tyrosine-protein kinase [Cohnella silvisoli]MCD9023683.1 CpsD/CapB family tyrosine-protein kinase [Cohnella silvisoli]